MKPESIAPPAIYTRSGAASIGKNLFFCLHASYPFAKITIWQDRTKVSARIKSVTLNKADVDRIIPYRILFSTGIQLVHHSQDVSPFVVFFSRDIDNVINALRQAGYPVTG